MHPTRFLRIEGFVVFVGALWLYFWQDGSVWLLILLGLAPDLSMLGYLLGPRHGSIIYNVFHTYTVPVVLAGTAAVFSSHYGVSVALIWIGHIGADRLFGYGLKFPSGFSDTHLQS